MGSEPDVYCGHFFKVRESTLDLGDDDVGEDEMKE